MKRSLLALSAALVVVASANYASARVASPGMIATQSNVEHVGYYKPKYKKFHHHKIKKPKTPTFGAPGQSAVGLYVVGGMICSAAGPIINAALGGAEPTSQQVLWHMAGCFIPPLGVYQFIQSISNP